MAIFTYGFVRRADKPKDKVYWSRLEITPALKSLWKVHNPNIATIKTHYWRLSDRKFGSVPFPLTETWVTTVESDNIETSFNDAVASLQFGNYDSSNNDKGESIKSAKFPMTANFVECRDWQIASTDIDFKE